MNISEQEFDAILKLSPEKRYSYFVKKVCDWEQIYTLKVDNFIIEVIEKLISNDVVNALIFPVPDGYGFVVSLNQLKSDIEKELENY